MIKRCAYFVVCLVLCVTLAGCTTGIYVPRKGGHVTLPPAAPVPEAPTGDTRQETEQTVLLYLPNAQGTRLIACPERISLFAARHPAEGTLRALLAHGGSGDTQPLSDGNLLQLSSVSPVEISGELATVNLAASALQMSHEALYVACQAITNTLTQWEDVRYVNVLVSAMQPGLDVGASVPAGCFVRNTADSIDTLIAAAQTQAASAGRRTSLYAALYFPALAGKGILAEVASITVEGRDKGQMILSLLTALSRGAATLKNVPALPNLADYLLTDPSVTDIAGAGGQCAQLRFRAELNDALIDCGVPRSVMMAALTDTLTSFVPGVSAVCVFIGEETVTSVTPIGVYEREDETLFFPEGRMRRSDFTHFLLSNCTLYFSDGAGGLCRVQRPIPHYETRSARYLLGCLMAGPQSCDSRRDTQGVLPEGLHDADLIGVGLHDAALSLNLSAHFAAAAQGCDADTERLMVYAMVNTLCDLPSVRSVRFYVAGTQPDTLGGTLYLPGSFMKNSGIVSEDR